MPAVAHVLLSMTVMVTPCLWYVVGMKLVMPYVKFPQLELFKVRPVQFGALPATAEQLFTNPWSRPKIEPNFEALSWFYRRSHKIRTNPGV